MKQIACTGVLQKLQLYGKFRRVPPFVLQIAWAGVASMDGNFPCRQLDGRSQEVDRKRQWLMLLEIAVEGIGKVQ